MIIGIGIDIVELNRIQTIVERNPRFIKKILTADEITLYNTKKTVKKQIEFLAGRFAGKEAFAKARGTGIGKVSFHDIEILTGTSGEPVLNCRHLDQVTRHISISHSRTYAIAQVILEQSKL